MEAGESKPSESTEKPNDPNLEIYRQKYETFRHFDKLRWQAPSIPLAIAAGFAALLSEQKLPYRIFAILLFIFGIVTLLSAYTMRRIGQQLEKNRGVLATVAKKIGDDNIPEFRTWGATKCFEVFLWCLCALCITLALSIVLIPGAAKWLGSLIS